MRFVLFAALTAALAVTAGQGQEAKKKDDSLKKAPEITEVGGRSLEQWIKEIASKDPSKRENAMRNITFFGPERAYQAVPMLLTELKKHSATTPIDLSVRVAGTAALGALIGSVEKPDLKHVGEAVTLLRRFCKDEQATVRSAAVQAIPKLGVTSRNAINEVMAVAQDKDTWQVRQAGLQSLAILVSIDKSPNPAVMTIFYKALNDSSMQVRMASLQALALLARDVDPAVKVVMIRNIDAVAQKDTEPGVQIGAQLALLTIKDKLTNEHLSPIMRMLNHSDAAVRVQAAQALGMMGTEVTKAATQPLISTLTDPDPNVVGTVIVALVQIDALPAVPMLTEIAADPKRNESIKAAAAEAVKALQKKKMDPGKKMDKLDKK